jgi:hypothetical protein
MYNFKFQYAQFIFILYCIFPSFLKSPNLKLFFSLPSSFIFPMMTVISQKNVDQKLFFGAWMWERVVGRWMQRQKSSGASVLFSHKTLGGHPFPSTPSLGRHPPPFFPWLATPSPPMATAHHFFLLPRSPPLPRSKD